MGTIETDVWSGSTFINIPITTRDALEFPSIFMFLYSFFSGIYYWFVIRKTFPKEMVGLLSFSPTIAWPLCLYFSLSWILLSLIAIQWIHPGLTFIYANVKPFWTILFPFFMLFLFMDLFLSIRKHATKRVNLLKRLQYGE